METNIIISIAITPILRPFNHPFFSEFLPTITPPINIDIAGIRNFNIVKNVPLNNPIQFSIVTRNVSVIIKLNI